MSADTTREGSSLTRYLARVAGVEPHEAPAVITAFVLFFCVLGGYFAVRPLRETIATIQGGERVADLWIVTSIGAVAIVPLYGWLIDRVRRAVLMPSIYGFVAVSLVVFGYMFRTRPEDMTVGAVFYVWISVLNLMLVSVFWSFLLELFDSAQAKRLFGCIAAGGTSGALAGPLLTDLTVQHIGNAGVLFIGATLFFGAIVAQRLLVAIWKEGRAGQAVPVDRGLGGNPFAGFAIVFRSPYLLMLALFVVLLSSVNTFLYFEQLNIVRDTFPDVAQRTQVFARIDYAVQTLTVLSQIFLTGRIAATFGVRALLVMVPLAMVAGFVALAALGGFVILAAVIILRRWGEYAFIRPGREMLFSRLDTESKYKAKSLIDVPVYRGADMLVAQLQNALRQGGLSSAGVALLGAGAALAWAAVGMWLGRRAERAATR
ncbi:MAG TPA: MFS transporter [Steroidobacteraceae bacterium]|nr:MFS transporter [Steroidobacteraceae bacterium]